MVRIPHGVELLHFSIGYDPEKAHEYYLRTRKLHPRQKRGTQPEGFARANQKRHQAALPRQKAELQARITNLSKKLSELDQLIQQKEAVLKRDQATAKATAKKNSKDKTPKPQTAAEKAKAARDAKKYRAKNQQKLKNKAKQASNTSGGGSSSTKKPKKTSEMAIADLKALRTKVKGQLEVAKQKLAAL